MYGNKRFLAIIPARKGSKRCPGKNTRFLGPKALILWTIEAAKQSMLIDEVIVTSDDPHVLEIAHNQGVVTINRPDVLATDQSSSADVVIHALDSVNEAYDYFILLQPTSPFRNQEDIDLSIRMCVDSKARNCVSFIEEMELKEGVSYISDKNSINEIRGKVLRLNGAIYVCEVGKFKRDNKFVDNNTVPYIMPKARSIDIDTEEDFKEALKLYEEYAS